VKSWRGDVFSLFTKKRLEELFTVACGVEEGKNGDKESQVSNTDHISYMSPGELVRDTICNSDEVN